MLTVLEAVARLEPTSGSELAATLDRDPSTVSHHLSRLADAGLVKRERDGPALHNSLAPEARPALDSIENTADDGFEPATAD